MTDPLRYKAPSTCRSSAVLVLLAHVGCCVLLTLLLVAGPWSLVALPRWPWAATGLIVFLAAALLGGVWFYGARRPLAQLPRPFVAAGPKP